MDLGLRDKTVLVTGASGGIGQAVARVFSAEGSRLVLHAFRNVEKLRDWSGRQGFQEEPLLVAGDVGDPAAVDRMFETALAERGRVDVCVVNAGIWPPRAVELRDMDEDRVRSVVAVNLLGAVWTARAFLRALGQTGPRADGAGAALVLVGSTAGRFGERGHCEYSVTKAGLEGLLLTLKNEIVSIDPCGRVNLVEPGWTITDMTRDLLEDAAVVRSVVATMALRQIATADDVARVVAVLASPIASRHVTGQAVTVAGGMEGRRLWRDEEIDIETVQRRSEESR